MTDYNKMPWKHRVNWEGHLVTKRMAIVASAPHCIAICQCKWSVSVPLGNGQGFVARDDAIDAHWKANIAAAEKASAT